MLAVVLKPRPPEKPRTANPEVRTTPYDGINRVERTADPNPEGHRYTLLAEMGPHAEKQKDKPLG